MRSIFAALGFCVLLSAPVSLRAQGPTLGYEKDEPQSPTKRQSFAEQRIYARAAQSAVERDARIEQRAAMGISPQRPAVNASVNSATNILYMSPWRQTTPHRYPYSVWIGP